MEIKAGFIKSEVGIIPEDWSVKTLSECCTKITDGTHDTPKPIKSGVPFLTAIHVKENFIDFENCYFLPKEIHDIIYKRCNPEKGDVLMVNIGAGVATTALVTVDYEFSLKNVALLKPNKSLLSGSFLNHWQTGNKKNITNSLLAGGAQPFLSLQQIGELKIALPNKVELTKISTALSDSDRLFTSLEKLINKKRNIKQGAMQELLKPQDGWSVKTVDDLTICLDSLRVPLNDAQRSSIKGDYPYCGANGVLDFINEYRVDDDIILIAEDGGYFDEYSTRPIAYKMSGKCWVNNHAHILKAKENIHQDFIYYSLVHKNILRFLASGTRAKLNKSEMYKIEIDTPKEYSDQIEIATILSDIDSEITALETKLEKYKMIKQGMMQTLLTGQIRLV